MDFFGGRRVGKGGGGHYIIGLFCGGHFYTFRAFSEGQCTESEYFWGRKISNIFEVCLIFLCKH